MMHRTYTQDLINSDNWDIRGLSLHGIDDRAFWDGLQQDLVKELILRGEEAKEKPWSQILVRDYHRFSVDGNRAEFEELNFSRRRKINALIMAELVENQGRFMADIWDGLYLLLEESSWCLPAHNSHVRDAKGAEYPDTQKPVVDLFAAETGALLAVADKCLLQPFLTTQDTPRSDADLLHEYIWFEIHKRILTPYQTEHFWWMGNGQEPMCNWTVWITQNILLIAGCMPDIETDKIMNQVYQNTIRGIVKQAALSCDYFLDGYGDDGCCSEGAFYFGHAGLCLFGCYTLLEQITGRDELFCGELIRNIGDYIVRMYVGDGYYINFSDCAPFAGRRGAREYLFGQKTRSEALSGFAARDYVEQSVSERVIPDEINLWYHLLQAQEDSHMKRDALGRASAEQAGLESTGIDQAGGQEHTGGEEQVAERSRPADSYFESTGLMVARDDVFTLAVKAGNNDDSHNHNDVGSVILYKHHKPFLIDLGVETYTRKTFSADRYDIWTMQSQYHNLPTFISHPAGDEGETICQRAGDEFAATDVAVSLADDESVMTMDLAPAYGRSDVVHSYVRKVSLKKNQCVQIQDHFEGNAACVLSLLTYEKPQLLDGSSMIQVGELGSISIMGAGKITIEELPITDERLGQTWKHSCYRILAVMDRDSLDITIL